MNIFSKIILNLKIRKIKNKLKYFEILSTEEEYVTKIKYNNATKIGKSIDELKIKINEHNDCVKNALNSLNHLELNIKNIIASPINTNIKEYIDLNNVIKHFIIKNDLINEKVKQLHEIINKYNNILNQFNILNNLNNYFKNKTKTYLDQREKQIAFDYIDSQLNLIRDQEKYYDFILYNNKEKFIDIFNTIYLNKNINNPIFDNINGLSLDKEQRTCILKDDVSNLVIACAGSGKTLTICGKVKYLIDNQNIDSKDILVLSYSKASCEDLKNKLSKITPDVKVNTFHSIGLEIINQVRKQKQNVSDQFDNIVDEYFKKGIYKNKGISKTLMIYYSLYLMPIDEEEHFDELFEYYESLKRKKLYTLKKEKVKSEQELMIANYYYINGINYAYEFPYQIDTSSNEHRQYNPDFKLTDYPVLYHEHYGINQYGNTPQYSADMERKYKESIMWKRNIHSFYNTNCIETYSYQFNDGTIFKYLDEQLEKYNVKKNPISFQNIIDTINTNIEGNNFRSLIKLIKTFISLYKSRYGDNSYFDKLKDRQFNSVYQRNRTCYFIDICKSVYDYYYEKIQEENKIDFDNMIFDSSEYLNSLNGFKYKYIIVDEFQDISMSRLMLLQSLIKQGNSKLFCVGDDWQAIYRFAGCDINIFTNFCNNFPMTTIHYMTKTYRNSLELQQIVEPFITANPSQIKKSLTSDIHCNDPIKIYYYENSKIQAFKETLNDIYSENEDASILVLGRHNKDIESISKEEIKLKNDELFLKGYENKNITYRTVHSSKGLEDEYVILINGDDGIHGFPNQIEDDKILDLVLSSSDNYKYSEERRLFYVALTRAKKRCYIIVNYNNPSIFVKEIVDKCEIGNYFGLRNTVKYKCPKCHGDTLVLKEKDEKLFYCCQNYPYCDYITSNISMVKMQAHCPKCGYFLVKRKNTNSGEYFYGCCNYPKCTYTTKILNK